MHSIQFLLQLRQSFSEKDCQVVVSCLKQDPLVWESLKDPDFAQKAMNTCGKDVKQWNSGVLAVLSVYPECTSDTFTSKLEEPLPPDLCQKAIFTFEQSMLSGHQPKDLAEAALNALAIKERFRLRGTWQGIREELVAKKSPAENHSLFDTWATSVSCAYHLLSEPIEFLRALVPIRSSELTQDYIALCVHAILSSPFTLEEQKDEFSALLKDFPIESQLITLAQIQARGRSELTQALAQALLASSGMGNYIFSASPIDSDQEIFTHIEELAKPDPLGSNESLKSIESQRNLATLYAYAGENDNAAKMISFAKEGMKRFEARIWAQNAKIEEKHNLDAAIVDLQKVIEIAPESTIAKAGLAKLLIQANRWDEASPLIETLKDSPLCQSLQFKLALHSGERDQIDAAVLHSMDPSDWVAPLKAACEIIPENETKALAEDIDLLVDMKLTSQAVALSKKSLASHPQDKAILNSAIKALLQNKSAEESVETSLLGVIAYPEELDFHKLLASAFETNRDYQKAFVERQEILEAEETPEPKDQLAFAATALAIGQVDITIANAENVLHKEPENGHAHTLIGKALLQKEDKIGARDHFATATLSTPEQAEPWLELSKTLQILGDQEKSLETLRSAAHAVPNCSQILFALGSASLEAGRPSEGLPALREAFSIDSKTPEIACRLGNTLYDLGHFDEADQILATARKNNPEHNQLAFLHGQIQLVLGDAKSALQSLLISAKSETPNPEYATLLAQTAKDIFEEEKQSHLLSEPSEVREKSIYDDLAAPVIVESLQKVLQGGTENFEVNLLLGESLLNASQPEKAFPVFSELIEDGQSKQSAWNTRVQVGFGEAAAHSGKVDTAIASLQEAAAADPESVEIHSALVEALQLAHLNQEALTTARETLTLDPENLRNLFWFSKKAIELDAAQEAIQSLESAKELAPERADILLRLSQLYFGHHAEDTSKKYLTHLLEMPELTYTEYRQAARLLYKLQDYPAVIQCLESAKEKTPDLPAEFYVNLAETYDQCGNLAKACDNYQKAAELQPQDPEICMMQAEIFNKMAQKQPAIDTLEKALELSESQIKTSQVVTTSDDCKTIDSSSNSDLAEKSHRLAAQIHFEMANLLHDTGKSLPALEHAQSALSLDPKDLQIRSQAVELAYGLMEDNLASSLAKANELLADEHEKTVSFVESDAVVNLLSFIHETAMDAQDRLTASKALSMGLAIDPDSTRLLAQQAKKLAKDGDIDNAERLFAEVYEKTTGHKETPAEEREDAWSTLALAEAALELKKWKKAMALFKQAIELDPHLPRMHARYAHAMIVAAENEKYCEALNITQHSPANALSKSQLYEVFESELASVKAIHTNDEIEHQAALGQATFEPSDEHLEVLAGQKLTPEDLVALVSGYGEKGQLDTAIRLNALSTDNSEVAFQLAFSLKDERPENSKALLTQLNQKYPSHPYYPALLAILNRVNPFEARKWIEKAMDLWPDEIEWHKFAAGFGKELGEPLYELEQWKKIVALNPSDANNQIALGKVFMQCGQMAQAIAVLNDAGRLDPSCTGTWKELANAYLRNKNYTEAINTSARLLNIEPENQDAKLIHGKAAFALNQIDVALQKAEAVLDSQPDNAEAQVLYSQALGKKGRIKEALFTIEKGLNSNQNSLPLLLEKVQLIKQSEGTPAALPHLLELTKNYPEALEGMSLLANAYSELGQFESAEKAAQKALQLSPDDPEMHLLLGHIQRAKGQLDQSIHYLDEAIKQSPTQVEAYLELGKTYQDRRDNHRALRIYHQATQVAPEDFRAFYQAGLVFRENKDYINAESMFRRAAKLAPENVNIKRQLGAMITLNLVHNPQMVTIGHEY